MMDEIGEVTHADEPQQDGAAGVRWPLWSTWVRIVVSESDLLAQARELVADHLGAVETACSRFRSDSEIVALGQRQGRPTAVSPLLAELLQAALTAAERTDGDVDPTVGAALDALGYDRDYALIGNTPTRVSVVAARPANWTMVTIDERTVTVPDGIRLDLGATAKAVAADHCARLVTQNLGCGVLISLGGDIATAGPAPDDGWQILVQDGPGEPACQVSVPAGGAIATSSTQRRRWTRGGRHMHHVLDPRTGRPADTVWRTVSIAAGTCLDANTVSTACIVRGRSALPWLAELGLPARLVDHHGRVRTLGGWPEEPRRVA
jgi:thiamine biosynthesis lipoprotein